MSSSSDIRPQSQVCNASWLYPSLDLSIIPPSVINELARKQSDTCEFSIREERAGDSRPRINRRSNGERARLRGSTLSLRERENTFVLAITFLTISVRGWFKRRDLRFCRRTRPSYTRHAIINNNKKALSCSMVTRWIYWECGNITTVAIRIFQSKSVSEHGRASVLDTPIRFRVNYSRRFRVRRPWHSTFLSEIERSCNVISCNSRSTLSRTCASRGGSHLMVQYV